MRMNISNEKVEMIVNELPMFITLMGDWHVKRMGNMVWLVSGVRQ